MILLNLHQDFILTEINIFESIFSHSIVGSVIVADTRELITKGAFAGQERLSMKIQTPSPDFKTKFDDGTTKFVIPERYKGNLGKYLDQLVFEKSSPDVAKALEYYGLSLKSKTTEDDQISSSWFGILNTNSTQQNLDDISLNDMHRLVELVQTLTTQISSLLLSINVFLVYKLLF